MFKCLKKKQRAFRYKKVSRSCDDLRIRSRGKAENTNLTEGKLCAERPSEVEPRPQDARACIERRDTKQGVKYGMQGERNSM